MKHDGGKWKEYFFFLAFSFPFSVSVIWCMWRGYFFFFRFSLHFCLILHIFFIPFSSDNKLNINYFFFCWYPFFFYRHFFSLFHSSFLSNNNQIINIPFFKRPILKILLFNFDYVPNPLGLRWRRKASSFTVVFGHHKPSPVHKLYLLGSYGRQTDTPREYFYFCSVGL